MKVGWEKRRLGDVCAIDKVQGIHPGLPYVGLEDIQSNTGRFAGSLTPKPVKSSTFRFSSAHVLYGRLRPYLNKAIAPDFEGHCSTEIFPIKPSSLVSRDYLLYWLLADETMERINATCTGARMPRADMNEVLDFELPIPPLPEQQRIVALLDEAFAGLATAQAHAAQNLHNARALFDSHLQSVFSKRGEGWVEKRLGEVAVFKNGLNYTRESRGQTLSVVGVGDFQSNTVVPVDRLQTATIDGELSPEYALQRGDILTVRSNGSKELVGRCMLVPEHSQTTSYSGFIIRIRVNAAEVFPAFLIHFMRSSDTRDRLTSDGGGANISNINQTKLAALPVSLPPVTEQMKVVTRLDALAAETQRLARIYEQKQGALAALKKSLLHRAFSGEL